MAGAILLLALFGGTASAHPVAEHVEPVEEAPSLPPALDARSPALLLGVPAQTVLGEPMLLEATLIDADGDPIEGAPVVFYALASWGHWLSDEMELGSATTDPEGRAVLAAELRREGDVLVGARFEGSADHVAVAAEPTTVHVAGTAQLYRPETGIRVPWVGVWLLVLVVATIWILYLFVGARVFAIARASSTVDDEVSAGKGIGGRAGTAAVGKDRRAFLTRFLVPAGLTAGVAALGSGLVAIIVRSPRTHATLEHAAPGAHPRHRMPPLALVGAHAVPRPLPALLDREVSFSGEVLPILLEKGGPHAHPPRHSPSPHGIRLDGYDHIMGSPGLVVPGRPEESMLVQVLVDPAMQMPPGIPLPDHEIQVLVTWVAQGAKDN